jgi:hypothetical protein
MPLIQIKHRSNRVLFELECGSLRLALEAAVKSRTHLGGAHLDGAHLGGAHLDGFTIDGAIGVIQAGRPNNWPAFGYVDEDSRALRVRVGCRHFEIGEGRTYWSSATHPYRDERREVLLALDYIEAAARLRGWAPAGKEAA